ncbi:MAG: 16S rRNA (cytosine(967)-C(5))-methyltransferase RsmB [Pseudomonadales bacterium]|nr:16S rRNA (cytosine(967)-C(5))-methyltransferase RsmB [Pseudomonadales bacterium]
MKTTDVRARAARLLSQLLSHQGSLASLAAEIDSIPERALLREMCFGTCRWYFQLAFFAQQLLQKPLKSKDQDIHALLLIGLYQLHFLRVPDYAVVNETVAACTALKKPWARALVNAVLRNFLRQQQQLVHAAEQQDSTRFAHPPWLISQLRQAWPDCWQQILTANNQHPPMTLRSNRQHTSREAYLQALRAQGIDCQAGTLAATSIFLDEPLAVEQLPAFEVGAVSIQDEASQLIPELLLLQAGQRILDACAAPGGKTAAILEQEPGVDLLALELEPKRLPRIEQNLSRLGLWADIRQADAGAPEQWWDGRGFDRILLDAPCSATGIIRRQPDIKILRRETDIPGLLAQQQRLLQKLWPCLNPGGLMLYSTCSILPAENSVLLQGFVAAHDDAKEEAIVAPWGVECGIGRQLLPTEHGPDGFYFARLRKRER